MDKVIGALKGAADQGHAEAQFGLGLMYRRGQGMLQSDKEAGVWYRKAADQGDADAQWSWGLMYKKGFDAPKNVAKALSLFLKAAAQGFSGALELADELEAIQPSPAGMGPVQCANCGALEPYGAAFKPCARCRSVAYCGRVCQTTHWKAPGGHTNSCRAFSTQWNASF